jgi:signal transduction histidine kinase
VAHFNMNTIRWHRPKWLPRFLAPPVAEPSQQATRILAFQRNIVLPAKLVVTCIVFYYLFPTGWGDLSYPPAAVTLAPPPREWVIETLQGYFIIYLIINAIAALLLLLRRFPYRLVPWVVFTAGLVDGVLLAGLTLADGMGFGSNLYWVFPGLIVVNALSIPLAAPQIVLNLSLSAFYLGAGLLNISISEPEMQTPAALQRPSSSKFSANDIVNLELFAKRLTQPSPADRVSIFFAGQLQEKLRDQLTHYDSNDTDLERDFELKKALALDLNRITQGPSIYEPNRFGGVKLTPDTQKLLDQPPPGTNASRLNLALLFDAYPKTTGGLERGKSLFKDRTEPPPPESTTESFVMRLIILWLMTASCYGVQLLGFRQQVAEEEARKSAARNDELKAAGRLAAEIAHQLKNPLGIITNAVFTVQKGVREGRNNFTMQFEIIREEIERSDRILTQLMGYAQLSEGRVEKLDLANELDRAIAEVTPPGTTYEIQIHRHYGTGLPGLLMQRNHFSVVMVNLLQNAREALNGHGNISILASARGEHSVEVIVADDGPGIPKDKLDKVFEAYFSTKDKGTGLGLAIVRHNVELYGGTVRVESELGKGARFVLSFPAKTVIESA